MSIAEVGPDHLQAVMDHERAASAAVLAVAQYLGLTPEQLQAVISEHQSVVATLADASQKLVAATTEYQAAIMGHIASRERLGELGLNYEVSVPRDIRSQHGLAEDGPPIVLCPGPNMPDHLVASERPQLRAVD